MKFGVILLVIFIPNFLFSLFFTYGESFQSHIPAIILSVVAILGGTQRIIKHKKAKENK